MEDLPIALVLDDDEDFACSIGELLRDAGYAVTWATSVEGARRMIDEHPIAVVLVDLRLGELRGRHLLDDLAGIDGTPPMMIVSAADDATAIAAEFGVPCVRKPFQVDALLAAIDVTRKFRVRPVKRTASGRRAAIDLAEVLRKPKSS
jgi:DNA-binding response OmpR family regulator